MIQLCIRHSREYSRLVNLVSVYKKSRNLRRQLQPAYGGIQIRLEGSSRIAIPVADWEPADRQINYMLQPDNDPLFRKSSSRYSDFSRLGLTVGALAYDLSNSCFDGWIPTDPARIRWLIHVTGRSVGLRLALPRRKGVGDNFVLRLR